MFTRRIKLMKNKLIKGVLLGILVICMLSAVETTNSNTGVQICGEEVVDPRVHA